MMASSKVMVSASATNPDLQHQSSSSICSPLSHIISDLQSEPSRNFGSMSMDDLLKSYYSDQNQNQIENLNQNPNPQITPSFDGDGNRTVDEVWKEIVAGGSGDRRGGGGGGGEEEEEMTLEDFLTKAGAVREEDVRGDLGVAGSEGFSVEAAVTAAGMNGQFQMQVQTVEGTMVGYGKGADGRVATSGGRGKRRAVQEPQVDKATQQKQRRMIKNRESAARSRERKQAYTVELEALVTQLEEENARLLREEAEHNKERLKQLMENFNPVAEKQGTAHVLRRVHSMKW